MCSNMKFLVVLILTIVELSNGARILAIQGTDITSHFKVFISVVEHLTPFNNITLYCDERFNYKNPNVTIRKIIAPNRFTHTNISKVLEDVCNLDSYSLFYNNLIPIDRTYFDTIFLGEDIQQLISSNKTYDLLLINGYGTEHMLQFAHKLNIPLIQITPSLLFPWHSEGVSNPFSWTHDFSFMVPYTPNTFLERLTKFIKHASIWYRYYWDHMTAINSATELYFPPGTPTVEEINRKTDLIFVNTHSAMGYAQPNVPSIVEIGGLHIKPLKPLPNDLEEFISGAGEHGFIYFSLGSLIKESGLSEHVRLAILNVFRKLPQRVLWKWGGDMPDAPSNVKIAKWFPQGDILGHERIKLFIMQGGMLSMQEAVFHGVPVLILPVIFDQYINAHLAEQKGYGRSISFCHFTEEIFRQYAHDLIYNPSFSVNVKKVSQAMQDQNLDISEKVNSWVNFVVRHKGTATLRPVTKHQPWTYGIPFDVLSFFLFVILTIMFLSIALVIYMCKCINTCNIEQMYTANKKMD